MHFPKEDKKGFKRGAKRKKKTKKMRGETRRPGVSQRGINKRRDFKKSKKGLVAERVWGEDGRTRI